MQLFNQVFIFAAILLCFEGEAFARGGGGYGGTVSQCKRLQLKIAPKLAEAKTCKLVSENVKDKPTAVEVSCDLGNGVSLERLYISKGDYASVRTGNGFKSTTALSDRLVLALKSAYEDGKCESFYELDKETVDKKLQFGNSSK